MRSPWTALGVSVLLAALVWAVFGPTAGFEFVEFDDDTYVYDNPIVARGLTLEGIVWAFTGVHSDNWHPLTWLSHMLDCQLYGSSPGGHHLTSVLLHTATAILLFLVLRQMTAALWRSAFAAAVFAIHPLRVESVAWVAERKDVLSGLFFVLTLGAYVRYARRPWSLARYGLVVLLFALGLMCKPMLVTLPLVLLLLDRWPLALRTTRRRILDKLPLLGLAAASCAVTLVAQTTALQSFEKIPLPSRAGNALVSCVTYIGQMFWPSCLAVFYPFPRGGVAVLDVAGSVILLVAISAGVFALRPRRPYLLTGWLWYLVMLGPVSGLLQVGLQARADRYTYLPQIGLVLLLTWTAADLGQRLPHRRLFLGGLSTILLLALAAAARGQVSHWREGEALWTRALSCTPGSALAHYNFGTILLRKGKTEEAIAHYERALEINPRHAEAHNNLGVVLFQRKAVDQAISHYRRAMEITPGYAAAHRNLGLALSEKGELNEAIPHYRRALEISPGFAEAHFDLATALVQKGEMEEAASHYRRALELSRAD